MKNARINQIIECLSFSVANDFMPIQPYNRWRSQLTCRAQATSICDAAGWCLPNKTALLTHILMLILSGCLMDTPLEPDQLPGVAGRVQYSFKISGRVICKNNISKQSSMCIPYSDQPCKQNNSCSSVTFYTRKFI